VNILSFAEGIRDIPTTPHLSIFASIYPKTPNPINPSHPINSSPDEFWTSPLASRVKHPARLRSLLEVFSAHPEKLYDLTFHASFAHKLFGVLRREGKDAAGFTRMQQSFSETVQYVRKIVSESEALGFSQAQVYSELSPKGMASLLDLIEDLATFKEWQNDQN